MNVSIKTLIAGLFVALMTVGASSWADMDHDEHHDHAESEARTAEGVGEIRAIQADEGKITLNHEAIDELSMPAMTMEFILDSAELAEGFEAEDAVRFKVEHEGGEHRILELEAR